MSKKQHALADIVALCNNRGFIYQGSEIYGGLANSWDYGPYGTTLKNRLKAAWWRRFIETCPLNVGIDAAILMNPQVWVASGHVAGFSDPMIDCRQCRARARADQLIDQWNVSQGIKLNVDGWENEALHGYIHENRIPCPQCGAYDFTDVRKFNLMFKTYQGVTEDSLSEIYLRPETAQGIFVNYRNVQRTSRRKIPFGIGQIGKAFRNEITPGNFIFRTREFEQMELEFFCEPGTDLEWFEYWCDFCVKWLNDLGLPADKLRLRAHSQEELSFYSLATTDIEYLYPFGWGELWGIADRTDYDLKQHMEHAKEDLSYFDPEKGEKYVPYVVEPSLGVDRLLLAMLCEAYEEEELSDGEKRTVLRFAPFLAPVQVAVLPLSNKLREDADKVYHELVKHYVCEFDDRQSIGRRYRRQDEIGTPYCVTFDFDSLEDHAVTIRERDSMEQVRVPIDQLVSYFNGKFDLP
ncbi:MAG TPA: glycine--tRNA ligase [Bacillota bacterium]|jgi:glycyl-tRNA synthetase|nr:glycine--tRNA ligase [Bacillota bacterium]HQC49459.1 glycine--tRNA ligase [Bacillota bacterium]